MKIQLFIDEKEVPLSPIFLEIIEGEAEKYAKRLARKAKTAESS